MADNYLEKRYRDVFGDGSSFDSETGYARSGKAVTKIPRLPEIGKHGYEKENSGSHRSGSER